MKTKEKNELEILATKIRLATIDAIHSIGVGHLGGALSIADVLAVLYGREMKYDPKNPSLADRDKLVCSKGHAGPAVYATLSLMGFFPYEMLHTLNKPHTNLPSHCDMNKTPGIDMTTGSLGQGTSLAVGMALGDKIQGKKNRVFCIVGDGETSEGQVWEAISFAVAKKVNNLVFILDWNKKQLDGYTKDINETGDFEEKFKAFGLNTIKVNGNNVEQIADALEKTRAFSDKPYMIILDTIKGSGIKDVEEMFANHSVSISDEQFNKWTIELNKQLKELESVNENYL